MQHALELELIEELRELKAAKSAYLNTDVTTSAVARYQSPLQFAAEKDAVFARFPHAPLHAGELDGPGTFRRCDVNGLPVLVTRDRAGKVRAFLNVCRHRGARLVEEESGCKHRFTCPYHAWTYDSAGPLVGAPHFDSGFAGVLDKDGIALKSLPACEAFGLIWVVPDPGGTFDFSSYFAPLAQELEALGMADMAIVAQDRIEVAANWKIIVEGGIEAYHFKVAHRATIGPFFEDNLSSYRTFGPHMRSILPRTSMAALDDAERGEWKLRDHANVLYTLFPLTQLLVQQDHVVCISSIPAGPETTELRLCTIASRHCGKGEEYWSRNHAITMDTLREDFAIGEGIQAGLSSGANDELFFGRFEGALGAFNRSVDQLVAEHAR
ncbi:SRPBCC family protein [Erythrobacteraceae bacterium WH01K]|nr:SRPBCC family protein [Erythrobacteraceae bacterium WH01K]